MQRVVLLHPASSGRAEAQTKRRISGELAKGRQPLIGRFCQNPTFRWHRLHIAINNLDERALLRAARSAAAARGAAAAARVEACRGLQVEDEADRARVAACESVPARQVSLFVLLIDGWSRRGVR